MTIPKIFAHRGASAHAPENTMAAFQLAAAQHADGIELDVMLSKDAEVVVIHDDTVDRTTNGTGRVREMTLSELKALDAGDGQEIPTLKEVIDEFGGKLLINIELKNLASLFDRLPILVAQLLQPYEFKEKLIISSFNPFNLVRFRRQLTGIDLGLLTTPHHAKNWLWRMFRYDALHPYFEDVDRTLVAALHAQNRKVNVWTPDEPDDFRRLAALGVDSIITNYPQRAREVLES